MQHLRQQGFTMEQKIGFGLTSNVFRVVDPKKKQLALKWINHRPQQKPKLKTQAQLEVILLRDLSHPGIIRSKQVSSFVDKTFLFLQYCPKGDMREVEVFVSSSDCSSQQKSLIIQYYLAQIVNVLLYLKKMGIIHRDIKLQNFVLTDQYSIKLIDFGLSNLVMQDDTLMSQEAFELDAILKENKNLVGSRHYFPPEMVGPKEKRLSSFQLDVWCLGILAFKLFCNRFPFETKQKNLSQICRKIRQEEIQYPDHLNAKQKEFLEKCLEKDPEKRIKIQQIPSLSLFSDIAIENIFEEPSPIHRILYPENYAEKQLISIDCKLKEDQASKFNQGRFIFRQEKSGKKSLTFKPSSKKKNQIKLFLHEVFLEKRKKDIISLENNEGKVYCLKFSDEDRLNQVVQNCIRFSR